MPEQTRQQPERKEQSFMKPVYCSNRRRCNNGRPIGMANLTGPSFASFNCPLCKTRTVVSGRAVPHWG